MLRHMLPGDRHRGVAVLQRALNERAPEAPLPIDGFYSSFVRGRVARFQQSEGLRPDGIVGPMTIEALKLDLTPTRLKDQDFEWAARRLDVHPAFIHAFVDVESRGKGFDGRGNPIILFERHYFWKECVVVRKPDQTSGELIALRKRIAQDHPDICSPRPLTNKKRDSAGNPIPAKDRYLGGEYEQERLQRARQFSDTAALNSCSWGMFQIMGVHAKRLKYEDVQQMVRSMQASELDQLDAFCRFIEADSRLLRAVHARDFATVARIYNGPNYAAYDYDTKLATAFRRWGGT